MSQSVRLYLCAALLSLLGACANQAPHSPQISQQTTVASLDQAKTKIPTRPFQKDTLYSLLVAEIAGARQQYDLALHNYLAQAYTTKDPQVITRTARLAQYLHDDDTALKASHLWVAVAPDNVEAQYMLATSLAKNGDVNLALRHMQIVDKLGGTTNYPLIATAALRLDKKTNQELLSSFQQALEKNPDSEQLLLSVALILQKIDPEKALASARKILRNHPNNLHALSIESFALQQLGRSKEAVDRLTQALQDSPNNTRLRLQLARLLTQVDLSRAYEQFAILYEQAPNNGNILFSLALIEYELKDYNNAEIHFRQLRQLDSHIDDSNLYLGMLEEKKSATDSAIEFYQQVGAGPNYMPAMQAITRILSQRDDTAKLTAFFDQQRIKHPSQVINLYLLQADERQQKHYYQQAIDLINTALKQQPDNTNLLYSRSLINEKLGHIDALEADLRAVIALQPKDAAALNALGYVLTNYTTRYQEAKDLITQALAIEPNDPAILDSMGWVLYKMGDNEQALLYLKNAFEAFPDAEVAAHFGEVLWSKGLKAEASTLWQQSLAKNPDDKTLNETIKRLAPELLQPTQ